MSDAAALAATIGGCLAAAVIAVFFASRTNYKRPEHGSYHP